VPVNTGLAQISDNFVHSALVVYALAMLALAAEWAFGTRSSIGGAPVAVAASARGRGEPETAVRPLTRADRIGRMGFSLTVLAFGLHFAGVLARGLSEGRVPWGNMYEFSTASSLAVTGVYLALASRYDLRWLGVFVVTPVLLTLGLAVTVLYAGPGQLQPALQSYWLVIHVVAAVTASGAFTVGAAISLLYLLREWAARRGTDLSGRLARVPPSDVLDRLAYRVHAFAFPIWTFAVIAGAIWAERAWGRYWGWDPKETWAFITWVVYAAYLHARATAGWRGTRAAAVALVGFGCFLFNFFFINLVITGLHSYAGV
jgi:cytochrome c-type biogenesis protein CcsB